MLVFLGDRLRKGHRHRRVVEADLPGTKERRRTVRAGPGAEHRIGFEVVPVICDLLAQGSENSFDIIGAEDERSCIVETWAEAGQKVGTAGRKVLGRVVSPEHRLENRPGSSFVDRAAEELQAVEVVAADCTERERLAVEVVEAVYCTHCLAGLNFGMVLIHRESCIRMRKVVASIVHRVAVVEEMLD